MKPVINRQQCINNAVAEYRMVLLRMIQMSLGLSLGGTLEVLTPVARIVVQSNQVPSALVQRTLTGDVVTGDTDW